MDTRTLGNGETLHPPDLSAIRADSIWADYDAEADLFLVYLAPTPIPSVAHYVTDTLMVLTPLDGSTIIGFQVENWERAYLATQPKLAAWWPVFRRSLNGDRAPLILLAVLWLFESLLQPDAAHHVALAAG